MDKLQIDQAIVVEGRDDVRAVQEAADALIIPTHGYGISAETWHIIEKAYNEKGIVIFTDPDHAGREIRKKLESKFPGAIHAHLDREDARDGGDIGIENASPSVIAEALTKALSLANIQDNCHPDNNCHPERSEGSYASMSDLSALGLAGGPGSSELRARLCKELGIGYSNASSLIKKLRGFGIDIDELKKALEKIK